MVLGKSKTMKKFKFLNLIREKVSLYESDLSFDPSSTLRTKRVGLKQWAGYKLVRQLLFNSNNILIG
jgi:hypothetical protein